jgi:holliday junction DNA helicase RuvA
VYEFLEGEVAERAPARLVLRVAGVGYDLAVPMRDVFPAPGTVRVWTHLVVREDAHLLFGFQSRDGRDLFRLLLTVRGVGPGMALGILSALSREDLLEAILAGDAARLLRVKGVGRKTAEQVLLDLGDKAERLRLQFGASAGGTPVAAAARAQSNLEDAAAALVSIGFSEKDAKKQVERAAERVDPKNLEELVRAALQS